MNAPNSPNARLFAEPRRFRFDAAVRLLLRRARATDAADAIAFTTPAALAYPAAEVAVVDPPADDRPARLATPVMGLAGPAGVLPRLYNDVLIQTLRNRSPAMADFLDLLAQRLIGMFAGAGIKYRLHRSVETAAAAGAAEPDRPSEALLALTGYATPHLASRLSVGTDPLIYYSGLFSSHPRSAERLRALASDWLGRDVEVVQFAGMWLPLAPAERTLLPLGRHPGAWNSLGVDAAIGVRAWDPQARVILRIGPLDLPGFTALLPDRLGLQRLVALVRAFLGFETGFAINPVLAGPEIPPLTLDRGSDPAPRLGWNTWIPAPGPAPLGIRPPDGVEAVFEAETVEAEEARERGTRMSSAGGDWGGGYVTDVGYLPGYYRQQSPAHLNIACLLCGFAGIDASPTAPLSYLELGCGHGFSALALAASNPGWRVTGIDFNPAHIAEARELAADAGIGNAQFIEADLAAFAEGNAEVDIPEADVVTLHGLWSWVGDSVRAGVVRLLARRLRAGGVVYVSYNALPAWGPAIGMQRLLREAGSRLATRSDRQAAAGLEVVQALVAANARQLRDGYILSLIETTRRAQPAYLAHEFMNATWRPEFHFDLASAFRAAKLDWVASAELLENFSPLALADETRAVHDRFDEPDMRELIKDMCLERGFRQDVFVRGARRLSPIERDAALSQVILALACPLDQFVWEFDVPAGKAAIERDFFGPVVAALAQGPKRVRDLLELPDLPRRDNPGELVGMLIGTGQAIPLSGAPTQPAPEARRLNALAAQRFARLHNLTSGMALATSGSGAPLPCPMVELFAAGALGRASPAEGARWLAPTAPAEEQAKLAALFDRILFERGPLWRTLGAVAD